LGEGVDWIVIALIGIGTGFLAGLFGKGGSAVATPILAAVGVPPIVAVAAPLPATIPGTLVASRPYARAGMIDRELMRWSLVFGIPATIVGAIATRWIDGSALVQATDVLIAAIGIRFLVGPPHDVEVVRDVSRRKARTVGIALGVGVTAGLLANSGGSLLAPLFILVLAMPVKESFGTSLIVASALAVPGTVVHQLLGHLDWAVIGVYGAGSILMAPLGARVALRTDAIRLERAYGACLAALGIGFLVW
jgi:uncharacterized membrane protein YfcA